MMSFFFEFLKCPVFWHGAQCYFYWSRSGIIPPLVASIVDRHQVGVIVPAEEVLPGAAAKVTFVRKRAYYAMANPINGSDSDLLSADGRYWNRAPTCWCWTAGLPATQHHRDVKRWMCRFCCCQMCWFPGWLQNY